MMRLNVDARDVLVVAGLGMVGAGLWWMYPPAALVVIGGILFWAGRGR